MSQVVFDKIYVLLGMVIIFYLEPFHDFQAQSIVPMCIQSGAYAESTIPLKTFLVSQPE